MQPQSLCFSGVSPDDVVSTYASAVSLVGFRIAFHVNLDRVHAVVREKAKSV
jgi:hypothetical protein